MFSARIGWVTGEGLAANINKMFPRWLTKTLVGLLVVANTISIAADIGAVGEAARLGSSFDVECFCLRGGATPPRHVASSSIGCVALPPKR